MATGAIDGYSAQFQQFVSFAEDKTNTEKSIARLDPGGLDGRNITAADKDGIGGFSALFRRKEEKDANNVARDLFRSSVLAMFHNDMSLVPESVRKAMALDDYGKGETSTSGKPLTARRILAVKQAVDSAKGEIAAAVRDAKAEVADMYTDADMQTQKALDDLIETAIMRCGDDKDAIDIVKANIKAILRGGDAELRTIDAVKGKVDGLIANLKEIRDVAKGAPVVLSFGKQLLESVNGSSLPPGMIGSLAKMVRESKIDKISSLSPSSSGPDIHHAVLQFREVVTKAQTIPFEFKTSLDTGGAVPAYKMFAGALLVQRCSSSAIARMKSALGSECAAKVNELYNRFLNDEIPLGDQASSAVLEKMRLAASDYGSNLQNLKNMLDAHDGVGKGFQMFASYPRESVDSIVEAVDGGTVLGIMLDDAKEMLRVGRETFLKDSVPGNTFSANLLRDVYARRTDPKTIGETSREGLASIFKKAVQKATVSKLDQALAAKCRGIARGEIPAFYNRDVRLPGDKRLPDNFPEARNELTRLVSGQANITYEKADEKTKKKVLVVMALITQAADAGFKGYAVALDPNSSEEVVQTDKWRNLSHRIDVSADGALTLTFEGECDISRVPYEDGNVNTSGITLKTGFTLTIPADQFDGIAESHFPASEGTESSLARVGLEKCAIDSRVDVTCE